MKAEAQGRWLSWTLLTLLLAVTVVLRLPGFDGRALWVDELWRVNLILSDDILSRYWTTPDVYTAITAPVYLLVNRALGWFSASPVSLRLSSFLPGLASVALAYAIARRAGAGLVLGCGAALLIAANSNFIQYSNEFKPYMFEVMVHLACLYLWLDLMMVESTRQHQWIALCITLAIASLSAANIVFVLPAMAISLLDKVFGDGRRNFRLALGVFAVVGVLVIGLYIFIWSYGSDKGLINYWTDGFHDPAREGYLAFTGRRLMGLWTGAFSAVGARRGVIFVSVLGIACALYVGIRHRVAIGWPLRGLLIYGVTLLVTLLALNKLGLWPLGEIRPNLFLFSLLALLWILLLSFLLPHKGRYLIGWLTIGVVMTGVFQTGRQQLSGLAPPVEQSDRVWDAFSASTPTGQLVREQCKIRPVIVFLNPAMSHASHYYASHASHMQKIEVLTNGCVRLTSVPDAYASPEYLRKQIVDTQPSEGLYWHAYSHLTNEEVNKLKAVAREYGSLAHEESFEGAGYFAVVVAKNARDD